MKKQGKKSQKREQPVELEFQENWDESEAPSFIDKINNSSQINSLRSYKIQEN